MCPNDPHTLGGAQHLTLVMKPWRRLLLYLLIGAAMTVGSTWIIEHAAHERWSWRERDQFTLYRFGATMYVDSGPGLAFAMGWPMQAMGLSWIWTSPSQSHTVHALEMPYRRNGESFHMPLRPLWPGFAVNTVFYAASAWVLVWMASQGRRIHRQRTGHCTRCGYQRGDFESCPECGLQQDLSHRLTTRLKAEPA